MLDFRQTFLKDSIDKLTALETQVKIDFHENLRRDLFRTVHTVKGGAQTFDLPQTAQIAEELENTLSNGASLENKSLILEAIDVLLNFLRTSEPEASENFLEKLRLFGQKTSLNEIVFLDIPHDIFKHLSAQERAAMIAAARAEKNIYCAEAGLDAAKFAESYRNLQRILGEKSEIIASLPGEKYKSAGKLGFRILLASRESAEDLREALKDFDAEIRAFDRTENEALGLHEMLRQIVAHGSTIAERSGKEIRFKAFSNGARLSAERINDFFEIFLHLVRNAVDHGIEESGTIEMLFYSAGDGLELSVADDGGGIDPQKVRARAVAGNLIADDVVPDEREILEMIFAPGFSTAERVTEISGRGVGLDAVKSAVEKMNGKISVRNRKTKGAIFEISVPI